MKHPLASRDRGVSVFICHGNHDPLGNDTGVRLPLILDDVLVGLDDDRAERCIGELDEFSGRHQVILLTCHSSTADLARGAGAAVLDFPPRPSRGGT